VRQRVLNSEGGPDVSATEDEVEQVKARAASSEGCVVLEDVPWGLYAELREIEANDARRMTYLDGTLVIMSPEYRHEGVAVSLDLVIRAVTRASRIPLLSLRMTTLQRPGRSPMRGRGKESYNAYYVGPNAERLRVERDLRPIKDHPPPDLAVEVVNKADSPLALTVYAGLEAPEVWWFDARSGTLRFLRLEPGDGGYREIDRSAALPMLTPALVIEAIAGGMGQDETTWSLWLEGWAARLV
jgi:Uma2 family endonuclease